MPMVTLLCGPAGAGKTTYARELERRGAVRLSMDEAVWADGWRHRQPPQQRLDELYAALQSELARALADGADVVVDLSLASRAVRDEWRRLSADAGADCELLVVTAPFDVLWRRVQQRNDEGHANAVRLTEAELRRYLGGFDWPGPDEDARVIDTAD
ncbi:MAG: ATP-binding protein [Micropruina sp.]|uniref:AAA family ATPase n=1 Tax=Micropruina sp. TaxID=2737536 RepID=UPI0039E65C30